MNLIVWEEGGKEIGICIRLCLEGLNGDGNTNLVYNERVSDNQVGINLNELKN